MSINSKIINKKYIAVTIGDIKGIGIQILIKELLKNKLNNFILFTNLNIFKKKIIFPKKKINLIYDDTFFNYDRNKLNIYNFKTKNQYTNTLDSLKYAYNFTKKNYFKGILTLPLNKEKINKYVDKRFIDQTTFFSNKEKNLRTNMIFIYKNKFFIPLTIHIELKNVFKKFKNQNYILDKIKSLIETLKKDFNINKPKIIIAGINPHAGENNIISTDETKYLNPIINNLKKLNINITGPISGDSMINKENIKKYDAFIFTFHDQALIPFKIISNYQGVNFTSNLNIIRVSPSHGTAENLIRSNKVISTGVINCFNLIKKIHNNRN